MNLSCAISEIPLTKIVPGNNDRKNFNPTELKNLADCIQAEGLAQPITVRKIKGGKFEIVCGERRYRACQLLKRKTIEAIIRENMTDESASAVMLLENVNRQNLSPTEEAKAYQARLDAGWKIEDLSAKVGVSIDVITRRIQLLKLPDYIQPYLDMKAPNTLPITHAECMVRLDSQRCQMAWKIWLKSDKGISSYAFSEVCSKLQAEQDQGKLFELEEFFLSAVDASSNLLTPKASSLEVRDDLPLLKASPSTDTAGMAIEKYIHQLREEGFLSEAKVIATLYTQLEKRRFIRSKILA